MAWNDGTTTEDRARHTAIQTYDEIEGEDPGKHGFTNFDSGSAKAEVEMLRQQVRPVNTCAERCQDSLCKYATPKAIREYQYAKEGE